MRLLTWLFKQLMPAEPPKVKQGGLWHALEAQRVDKAAHDEGQ